MNNSKSDRRKAAAKTVGTKVSEVKETLATEGKEVTAPTAKKVAKTVAEKKPDVKPAAAKKEAVKPEAEKKAAPKKEVTPKKETAPVKEVTPKKEAAPKKTAKKETVSSVVIEYAGKQIAAKEILEAAKSAYESLNEGVEIKTIEIYVKPEENAAYYVVNGKGSDQYKVVLS